MSINNIKTSLFFIFYVTKSLPTNVIIKKIKKNYKKTINKIINLMYQILISQD